MRLWWRDEMHRHRGRAVHGCFGDWLASTIAASRHIQNGYIYISVLIGSIDEDLQKSHDRNGARAGAAYRVRRVEDGYGND